MKTVLMLFLFGCCSAAWVKEMEDKSLFQGDIILRPDEDDRNKNTFASIKGGRWPGGQISYTIDNSIGATGISAIHAAISDYHTYTCLRFYPRTNQQAYLRFYQGGGCSSPVGYRGTRNDVSLAAGCWYKGVVMHEIGHSIGLYHEQSRPDRDNHIRIIWNNINSQMRYNFNKQPASNINSLGTKYDYRSMMHYGKTAFSSNGGVTMQTIDPKMQNVIGQTKGFSQIDIKQINLMYCGGSGGKTTPPNPETTTTTPSTPAPTCHDKHINCNYWASVGHCQSSYYWSYMFSNCKKACRFC